ncbi:lipopolysaccharide biosynthesis protein [Inquilinus limosus]|uniref:lipopolysaccharide biosynthesis protein n=1 Tax=Inquilinus limosus TaxID=171674 RepID=UPI0012DC62DE|nr:lipopolysaccharide biosynthesis protein [Inquilinus limosus]
MIRIGLNLLILPILFHAMNQEELGLWLVLGQSTIFLGILTEAGFTPTITRRIAFAAGKGRAGPGQPLDEEARRDLADLLASGRIAFRFVSIGVFVLTFVLGSLYLWQLDLREVSPTTAWIAWTLLCVGYATTTWSGLWTALATGLGYVAAGTIIVTVVGVAALLTQMAVALAGGGLLGLAIVSAISGVTVRLATRLYVRRRQPQLFSNPGRWDRTLMRSMMAPSIRSWLTAVGFALLFKTDQYFIALYVDTTQVPAYYAVYALLHNLAILALALGQTSSVYVSQLWHSGSLEKIHDIVLRSLRMTLILMACGVATLLVVGRDLISVWIGPEHFAGYGVLTALGAMFLFCVQQNAILTFSRATENEVYAVPFLVAGGLNLVLSWALVQYVGLLGAPLATLLAQALTTSWIVLRDGLQRLQLSIGTYVRTCLLPLVPISLATYFATMAVASGAALPSALDRLLAGTAVAGCVCLAGLWMFGLTAANRAQAGAALRTALRRRQPAGAGRPEPPIHPG